jgi:hypothetical protein
MKLSCMKMPSPRFCHLLKYSKWNVQINMLSSAHLRGCGGQGCTLKALGHLPAELVGVIDGLEEACVLLYALDSKSVVDAADSCTGR